MNKAFQSRQPNWRSPGRYGAAIALLMTVVAMFLWGGQVALADDREQTGLVEARPNDTLLGTWRIGGTTFTATNNTEFRQDKGTLAVGVCAEVEYVGSSEPFTATKIASKNVDDCGGSGGTPAGTTTRTPEPSGTVTPNNDGEREVYGQVESMPSSGLMGTWTVNGVRYQTSGNTEFKQRNGPFVMGACVKIHYSGNAAPFTIRELETKSTSDCNSNSATPVSTPNATSTSTPDGERELYGTVDSFPDGLTGTWVINGTSYNATGSTEFKQEHGAFAVGACVKVHTQGSSTPATIREIETEQAYRCGGNNGGGDDDGNDDGSGEGELYGILQSYPAALVGNWNIGGMTFIADSSTEFKQEAGLFKAGITVKVHFRTDANGDNIAREIETRFANDDNGSDDDGNGSFEGAEGHAYGIIDSFPSGLTGDWQIGGIVYTATSGTRFEQSDGNFANGKQVKVEYYIGSNGERAARKIETTSDNGGATAPTRYKLFGFIDQLPANGFVGTWVVDNIAFTASSTAQFKEEHGLFGLGAYVAVEYAIQNGVNQVHEIETHVPPGAGPAVAIGRIDDKGGAASAAMATAPAATWTIAGTTYTVTPATAFNEVNGAIDVGSTVLVNSYTDGNGNQVATQIRGVTINSVIYLPAVAR